MSSLAVSIVIPTYNRLEYLKEAVDSVRSQTFASWELIVVDDGSTDDTVPWLESLGEPRITVVEREHTANRSLLRNLGVARARAPWIAFLDSDDLWLPNKLTLQLERLAANPACRWSSTGIRFIDAHGAPVPQRAGAPNPPQSGWILEELLMFTAAAATPTLMVHRSLFDEVGGFDEAFLLREDYELDLRLAAHSEVHALPEALTIVRQHAGRTSSSKRMAELHRGTEMVFRKAAQTTANERVRAICRRQCAVQLAHRASALSRDGDHGAALVSAGRAIREAPFTRQVWRSAVGCALRWLDARSPRG